MGDAYGLGAAIRTHWLLFAKCDVLGFLVDLCYVVSRCVDIILASQQRLSFTIRPKFCMVNKRVHGEYDVSVHR